MTIINDLPTTTAVKAAIDGELQQALKPYRGPWTVRLRPVDMWQGDGGWSVEVSRPGHVWTLRVAGPHQEPPVLVRHLTEAVQPERFGAEAE